jgi:crotonobetainyl-CoA:carnitine CoA-transferase CaiB-like acyl-CoA transferase
LDGPSSRLENESQAIVDSAPPALSGIKVIDLSRILAGPWCGQILADLGADVVKVERPGAGDDTRGWGPPWMLQQSGVGRESSYFQSANRGKRSVAVDIADPDGQSIVRDLVRDADVLIENHKVGSLARYGLDYASLSVLNPRLIYCSITGFGQTGPRAPDAGYDFIIQALGGLMSITGERDDRPGGGPQKVGVAISDLMTGLYAAIAIQAALIARAHSGVGQHCDLALFDVQLAALANQGMYYLATGRPPPRYGNAHASIVPYQVFRAQDGDLVVACGNDAQFEALAAAMGLAELSRDPRFVRNTDRIANREVLERILADRFAAAPVAEWVLRAKAAGVPASPINDIAQAFDDPQAKARNMIVGLPHPLDPDFSVIGNPIKMSQTPVQYVGAPPLLGEHSKQVLRERLGLDEAAIAALIEKGVVQCHDSKPVSSRHEVETEDPLLR